MDEKKTETSGAEESEQLGPYQLQEQVPQSPNREGELYLATHETSGGTALVLKPAEADKVPLKDWRVQLSASASEHYVAMQVEQTSWAVAPDKQSVESLVITLEEVHEGVRRMARALDEPDEPRSRWRLGPLLASVAAVCALLFVLGHLPFVPPPPSGFDPLADAPPVLTSYDGQEAGMEPFSIGTFVDATDAGETVVARPLPREPFKGQKRPPCTRYAEVELIGACWTPHELKAPCPDVLYEYQGKCYVPAFSAKQQLPQSLDQ